MRVAIAGGQGQIALLLEELLTRPGVGRTAAALDSNDKSHPEGWLLCGYRRRPTHWHRRGRRFQ
ncbi:MAG: hypothetical protein QOG18_2588 [Microbacteriaceae bacterium]|jgi:hypothetical protein|nr:hypothetical protein [Microbacteriaceae bacterium]